PTWRYGRSAPPPAEPTNAFPSARPSTAGAPTMPCPGCATPARWKRCPTPSAATGSSSGPTSPSSSAGSTPSYRIAEVARRTVSEREPRAPLPYNYPWRTRNNAEMIQPTVSAAGRGAMPDVGLEGVSGNGAPDVDVEETREWLDSLESVLQHDGPERARFLL